MRHALLSAMLFSLILRFRHYAFDYFSLIFSPLRHLLRCCRYYSADAA